MRRCPRSIWCLLILIAGMGRLGQAGEHRVYGVHRALDLGGGAAPKDYYVDLGAQDGVQVGSILEVKRLIPTFDDLNESFRRDVTVAVGFLQVTAIQQDVAVARLYPGALNASGLPVVRLGDLVQVSPNPAIENGSLPESSDRKSGTPPAPALPAEPRTAPVKSTAP